MHTNPGNTVIITYFTLLVTTICYIEFCKSCLTALPTSNPDSQWSVYLQNSRHSNTWYSIIKLFTDFTLFFKIRHSNTWYSIVKLFTGFTLFFKIKTVVLAMQLKPSGFTDHLLLLPLSPTLTLLQTYWVDFLLLLLIWNFTFAFIFL